MSRTLSANYTTENNKLAKRPVVRVAFNGVTRGYVSGTYSSLSANDKKFLINAAINLQKFDLLRAPFALIGDTFFEVLDKDDDVTVVLEGDNLIGVDITLSLGFQEIGTADFLGLPVTTIDNTEFNEDSLSFKFISKDARKLIAKKLFENQRTTLINDATGITVSDSTITVDSTTGFVDPTNLPAFMETDGDAQNGHIVIGSEIITYTGVTATTFTGCIRGTFDTNGATHEDNDLIKQIFIWRNVPAATALLTILMTTNDASGHAYFDLANYDVAFKDVGNIALTATEVDIDEIQQRGHRVNCGTDNYYGHLALTKEVSAITFIEEEILKPMAMFMYLKNNGKLTINSFDRIHVDNSFLSVKTLDNDEIVSISLKSREDLMINTIQVLNRRNLLTGTRSTILDTGGLYQHDESVTAYGSTQNPLIIDTTSVSGLSTAGSGINSYLYKWFYFFGNTPAILTVRVKYNNIALEPGDWVQITRSSLPQLRDGTKGWTNIKGLIISQKINPMSPNPLEYDVFVWDLYDRVTNAFSITSVTVTTDTTVTFDADNTSTVQAADGIHDFGGTPTIDWIIFVVSITKPNETPAGSWETISLGFHVQSPKGTDGFADTARYIPYFTEDSDTITYEILFCNTNLVGDTLATAKVDWYERSTTTAGKQVTISFDTVRYGTFDNTISAV